MPLYPLTFTAFLGIYAFFIFLIPNSTYPYSVAEKALADMYGKNLTFKTGGVDGCDCVEILELIEQEKIDTTPLITHRYALADIEEAYHIFENRLDGVIKIAIKG